LSSRGSSKPGNSTTPADHRTQRACCIYVQVILDWLVLNELFCACPAAYRALQKHAQQSVNTRNRCGQSALACFADGPNTPHNVLLRGGFVGWSVVHVSCNSPSRTSRGSRVTVPSDRCPSHPPRSSTSAQTGQQLDVSTNLTCQLGMPHHLLHLITGKRHCLAVLCTYNSSSNLQVADQARNEVE
jgi:hypothetical protein